MGAPGTIEACAARISPWRRSIATVVLVAFTSSIASSARAQESPSPVPGAALPPLEPEAAQRDRERVADRDRALDRERPAPGTSQPLPVALEAPLDADRYVCGAGDVFELNFWGAQNFKLRAAADLEGRAFVARIGYVQVAGKTLKEVRATVRKAIQRYFPGMIFEMSLAEPRTFLVHVVNNVAHPGMVRATQIERLSTVLDRAGGLLPTASRRRIEIRHRDGSTTTADLVLYALRGETRTNPYVVDGDIVEIPFEALTATINGGVNRAGQYELVSTKDFDELLSLAGGFSSISTPELPIVLIRRKEGGRAIKTVLPAPPSARPVPESHVELGDAFEVPTIAELQKTVLLVGAIQGGTSSDEATSVRRLVYVEGDTVRSLVQRAGGVLPGADFAHCAIVHANGATEDVDLEALLVRQELSADRPVAIGDTVMIPLKRRSVIVVGAVFRPGTYSYNPRFTISDYIAGAGGPTRFAQALDSSRLMTSDGHVKQFTPTLKVDPGDTVVVPERDFSRPEIVQLVLAGVGILLSGITIALTLRK